jgi:hypothetical protein
MASIRVGKPREPSVWGMLLLSTLTGLALADDLDLFWTIIAVLGVTLNVFTFDATMDSLRTGRFKQWLLLVSLNSIPYIVGLAYWKNLIVKSVIVGLALLLTHTVLTLSLGWKNPATYIMGAGIPVLPALLVPAIASGNVTLCTWIAWILLTLYAMTTASYIETRLAYRRMDPRVPLVTWLPSLAIIPLYPILTIALIEPWIKVLLNLSSRRLVDKAEEIKRMGWIELSRIFLFSVLLIFIIKLFC